MIYICIYFTTWLFCNTILLILAIRNDASWGVYFAILLFAALSLMIRVQIKTGDKDDERD